MEISNLNPECCMVMNWEGKRTIIGSTFNFFNKSSSNEGKLVLFAFGKKTVDGRELLPICDYDSGYGSKCFSFKNILR